MKILVLHNNFPAQFKHLLPLLVKRGHDVIFVSLESHGSKIKGLRHFVVKPKVGTTTLKKSNALYGLSKKASISELFRASFDKLKSSGFYPDLIVFHSGWGLGMHLRTIFPNSKLASFAEWWFAWPSPEAFFDPSQKYQRHPNLKSSIAERYLNLSQSLEFLESDFTWTATNWQKSQFPTRAQQLIHVFHEGVDTKFFTPLHNTQRNDSIHITYTTRAFEPIRGFEHFFEISLLLLSAFPNIRFTIVGKDKPAYRSLPKDVQPLGQMASQRYKSLGFDDRVTFATRLDTISYRNLLQSSDIHIYFSKPFIASWSLLEAMSSGCCIVASDIPMIREIVANCDEPCALLVDHMCHATAFEAVSELIKSPSYRRKLSLKARDRSLKYNKDECASSLLTAMGI